MLLARYFRDALRRLNPWITPGQMDEAQQKLEARLSTASLMQVNEEKYLLIRDGIPVTVKQAGGRDVYKRQQVYRAQGEKARCDEKFLKRKGKFSVGRGTIERYHSSAKIAVLNKEERAE